MATTAVSVADSRLASKAERLGVTLTPLHKQYGARVQGLDLTKPLDLDQQELLQAALNQYDLLLFRGRPLAPRDEQRVLLHFPHDAEAVQKQLWENAWFGLRPAEAPLIAVRAINITLDDHFGITTDQFASSGAEPWLKSNHLWHVDKFDNEKVPYISSMYMHATPDGGGDTLFCQSSSFLESLPEHELKFLESLKFCSLRQLLPNEQFMKISMGLKLNYEGNMREQPADEDVQKAVDEARAAGTLKVPDYRWLIVRDARTGRKSMVMSPYALHSFEGKDLTESKQLTSDIFSRCCTEERVYRHVWEPHDFVIWANRSVLHSASPTEGYSKQSRLFHLVFLNSDEAMQPACQPA